MRNTTASELFALWAAVLCASGCAPQPTRPPDPTPAATPDAGVTDASQGADDKPATPPPTAPTTSATAPASASAAPAGVTAASSASSAGSLVPLPKEPWYSDKPERIDECVTPRAVPARHFPAPFEACDPREEAWHSPPGGPELHFHYRLFSVTLTTERRKRQPGVCCYLIWEFPRSHRTPDRP